MRRKHFTEKSDYRKFCEQIYSKAQNAKDLLRPGETMADLFGRLDRFQQMLLLSTRPEYIQHVLNPDAEMRRYVLEIRPELIAYLPDTEEEDLQLRAIAMNPELVRYLNKPTITVQKRILEQYEVYASYLKNVDFETLKRAIWKKVQLINHFPETQDPDLQLFVVAKQPELVQKLRYPTRTVQEYIYTARKDLLKWVRNLDMDLVENSIRHDPYLVEAFGNRNLSEDLQNWLYEKRPSFIGHVQNIHKELQFRMYNDDQANLRFIRNPCEEIKVHQILER